MKKLIPFIILLLFFAGCGQRRDESGLLVKPPPAEDAFWKIYNESSQDGYNGCLKKAEKYAAVLKADGIKADVIVVDPGGNELHAVVMLENGNWFDPTLAKSGDDIEQAGRFLMRME